MKIAVEGCAHGELDKIYESIAYIEVNYKIKVDLLIICGDFQAVRNMADLKCMAVPPKYCKLNTFYKYYSGEKKAPLLTLFVGGNHEASNYLSELPYGGWVCENIYYMGYAGVIQVGGLRIAGLSGIYKGADYLKGHFEVIPYDNNTVRSVYHTRNLDVFKLKQITKPLDIVITHDWPRGIQEFGDKTKLLRYKPFLQNDMDSGKLGSRPSEELLFKLKPKYWFAAHLHCEFAALVPHTEEGKTSFTKFLALDKCLPNKRFLKIIDVESDSKRSLDIEYDPEWLCILRSTNYLLNVSRSQTYMPGKGCPDRWEFSATEEELSSVIHLFKNDFKIPRNFTHTANPHKSDIKSNSENLQPHVNPQTSSFCKMLSIDDPNQILILGAAKTKVKKISFVDDINISLTSERSIESEEKNSSFVESEENDDEEDYSGLFYIDKKRSYDDSFSSPSLASSPAPKKSPTIDFNFPTYNEQNTATISNSSGTVPSSASPLDTVPSSASPLDTVPSSASPLDTVPSSASPFQLKRRNKSLYTTTDDGE